MGGPFNPYASGSNWAAPASGWRSRPGTLWARTAVALLTWTLAVVVASVSFDAPLAPHPDERFELAPPPPPPRAPARSQPDSDVYFDPLELISV